MSIEHKNNMTMGNTVGSMTVQHVWETSTQYNGDQTQIIGKIVGMKIKLSLLYIGQ